MAKRPTYTAISPGRVNLIGEHTDYAGGLVLPMATDLHTRLDAEPAEPVTVSSAALDERRSFDPADVEPDGTWLDYVKGCYAALQREGYDPGGFVGELTGTLPVGAGLSSSASLELSVVALLNEAYGLGLSREQMARVARRAENEFVGVSCGIMDQFAVALGRDGHALSIDTGTREYEPVPIPEDVRIVVFDTGVERRLAESPYEQRRETVETALDALDADSSTELSQADLDELPPVQRRRLGYVLAENDRVRRAERALAAGELDRFGGLLLDAHRDLADRYEASCPELDYVVETAVEHGAYGARLTGAGWGGAAIAVVDESRAESFAHGLHDAYRDRFPERDASSHFVTPSAGVRVLDR